MLDPRAGLLYYPASFLGTPLEFSSSEPLHALAQRLQVLVGLAQPQTLDTFISGVRQLARDLPSGTGYAENAVLHGLVVEFARRTESCLGCVGQTSIRQWEVENTAPQFRRWADGLSASGVLTPFVQVRTRGTVHRVLHILLQEWSGNVRLGEIARRLGRNRSYLSAEFRRAYGLTFRQCLTRIRIARAAQLLRAGVKPEAVGALVGYRSNAEFYRNFRRLAGCTPGRFSRLTG